MNKRGKLTIEEAAGLILAVIVVGFLLYFLFSILAPRFNQGEEATKASLQILEQQLLEAKKGNIGEFTFTDIPKKYVIHLIYFNGQYGKTYAGHTYYNPTTEKQSLSVCYSDFASTEERSSKCSALKLDYPLRISQGTEEGTEYFLEETASWISLGTTYYFTVEDKTFIIRTKEQLSEVSGVKA